MSSKVRDAWNAIPLRFLHDNRQSAYGVMLKF